MADPEPRYYFSFRSPYSWLAHRELVERFPELAAGLRWVPFWEPDPGMTAELTAAGGQVRYTPMSRAKHLYILQDVARLCRARGLPIRWPVDRQPRWELPHLAYLVAAEQGRGPQFVAEVYAARWLRGADICHPDTVRAIARATGVDPAEAVAAADHPQWRAAGVQALLRIDRDGVFGVPFFVYGFDRFWGLDRLAGFVARLREPAPADQRRSDQPTGPEPVGAAGELDHPGGCG